MKMCIGIDIVIAWAPVAYVGVGGGRTTPLEGPKTTPPPLVDLLI